MFLLFVYFLFIQGSSEQKMCPKGTFKPNAGPGACEDCTPGYYCNTDGLVAVSGICPKGSLVVHKLVRNLFDHIFYQKS